jgi:hypothetical protein
MSYRVKKQYEGAYVVIDEDDGEQMAHISRFNPGPMVSVRGGSIYPPALAKAIARAMNKLANDLEQESEQDMSGYEEGGA